MKTSIFLRAILYVILSCSFHSCGYRAGLGDLPSRYRSICVPYVLGDKTGELTASLVKQISLSGGFVYKTGRADLILHVSLIDIDELNVGFRYDRNKKGKRERDLIPTETRLTAIAEVSVTDACSGCTLLGPAILKASLDVDHDYYFGSDRTNEFSLGQLTDYDAAFDSAQTPLYVVLAKKIVDYVIHSW